MWKWFGNVINIYYLIRFTGCLFKDAKQSVSLGPVLLIPL